MRAEASASGHCRPPTTTVAGQVGAPLSPSVRVRPTVPVVIIECPDGFETSSTYVRRFWVAAIGPSAVAELLRLIRSAAKGEDARLPRYLPLFLRAGLVSVCGDTLRVPSRFPPVPPVLRWRFPPGLAAEHARALANHEG